MNVVFYQRAQNEFDEAVDFYAEHASIQVAEAFILDIQNTRRRLAERPEIGISISQKLRILHLRHFPYSLIYRVSRDAIIVNAVAHQRRRPGYWSGRR